MRDNLNIWSQTARDMRHDEWRTAVMRAASEPMTPADERKGAAIILLGVLAYIAIIAIIWA